MTDVTTELARVPQDDGDANDDDTEEDAAIAAAIVNSSARVHIGGTSQLDAAADINISSTNTVSTTTTVDGTLGTSDAGGTVATSVVLGETAVDIQDTASVTAQNNLSIAATSDRTIATTAKATAEGATEDGDAGTMTEGQQSLEENNADTADGSVTLAAAVAVTTLNGDTRAEISGAALTAVTGNVAVTSQALHSVSTVADGTSTSGDGGTGVGVAVAIGVIDVESRAAADGFASLEGEMPTIDSQIFASDSTVSAKSGPTGDAEGADVGVAGALAINSTIADASATVGDNVAVDANNTDLTISAASTTESTATATPLEDDVSGESVGVGASIAMSIADHTTKAALGDANTNQVRDVNVSSNSHHDVLTTATSAAAGGTAVAAVVALTIANEDTLAELAGSSGLVSAGDVSVTAEHTGSAVTTAAGDSEGAGTAAVGAAVALNFVDERTEVPVARPIHAGQDVTLVAQGVSVNRAMAMASAEGTEGDGGGDPEVDGQASDQRSAGDQAATDRGARSSSNNQATPTSSTSDGSVSVAAAVGINLTESLSRAAIATDVPVTAGGHVTVSSAANSDASASADATAVNGSSAGVGAAVAINAVQLINEAVVRPNASIQAEGLTVQALMADVDSDMTHALMAEATSGAGNGDVGVAGAVSINLIDTTTTALVQTAATVDLNNQDFNVLARSNTDNASRALPEGDGGMGSDVGVGGSMALNRVRHHTKAEVEDGVVTTGTAANLTVQATRSASGGYGSRKRRGGRCGCRRCGRRHHCRQRNAGSLGQW